MFESLKKLFTRQAPTATSYAPYEPPAQSIPAIPAQAPPVPRPAPAVAPPPPRPTAVAPKPAPAPAQVGEVVNLPLSDIVSRLPATVAPLLVGRANGTFPVSIQSAIQQIGTGAVRVRFLELRRSAPPGTFANDASQDEVLIDLPLPQILAAIGPSAFARRSDQRVNAVPDDVTGVFGPKGSASAPRIVTKPAAPAASPAPPPPPAPARTATPPPPPAPVSHAPSPAPVPRAPQPPAAEPTPIPVPVIAPAAPVPIAAAPAATSKPAPAIRPVTPVVTPKPAAPAPLPFASQKPASPLPFATRPASPPPPPASVPVPVVAPVPAPAPVAVPAAAPVGDSASIVTTIAALCQLWPDSIHTEIVQFELGASMISIPLASLENGMKTGRVVIAWGEILGWLNPPASVPSVQGEVELELPLNVIAPLFIAKRRAAAAQTKVTVGEHIPDLFAGVAKPAPAPAPVVPPPAPAPVPARAPELSALGRLFGQPTKLEWSPQEIARQITALPGVTGSLLATTDGLLVAGQISPPLTGETLAAFAPQVFSRISTYADEIKLGTVRAVTLTTDSGPCAMFGAGQVFIAVVGKPGQTLPEATLLRVAAELTNLKS